MDKVKPLKIEDPIDGTEDDQGYPTQLDPSEDYVATKGIAFENQETHLIDIIDNEITFTDPVNNQVKLSKPLNDIKLITNNQLKISLELQTLKGQELSPSLSYFVDSFNDDSLIDASSSNYEVDYSNGYVQLIQGGTLFYNETTKLDFDNGTFNNTESFINVGSNGEIRKELVSSGGSNIIEDFEDTSNVFYNTKSTIIDQNFDDGTIGSWTEHLLANQWDSGIRNDYAIGSYGYKLNGNDWIESNTFNNTSKSNIKVVFYANTSELQTGDSLLMAFYDGSAWHVVQSVSPNQDGFFIATINDSYLGAGNKIGFDISNSGDWLDNDYSGYVDNSAFIDEVEVYQEVQSQLSQESSTFLVYDGNYSGKYNVNFITKELNLITIELSSIDISSYNSIKLRLRKPGDGVYRYQIEILDNVVSSWTSSELDFSNSTNWFEWNELISNITGIDKTNIEQVKISFIEDEATSEVFSIETPGSTDSYTYTSSPEIIQTFTPTETIRVGRIKMAFRENNNTPRTPFYVGIANPFGTTYAYATFTGDQVLNTTLNTAIAVFDQEVTLIGGQEYRLVFSNSENTWGYAWRYQETNNNYSDGIYYINGNAQSNDISFSLLSPLVNETIYIDNLEIEGNSTYKSTGTYLSQEVDLGLYPDSIDELSWGIIPDTDTISVRVKFASTQSELSTASWSSWYTNNLGADLSTLTPGKWFQYEVRWTGGVANSTAILQNVKLMYSVSGGAGNAIIISTPETTVEVPTQFSLIKLDDSGSTGTIQYFISRNNGTNWQLVNAFGSLINFTSGVGTQIQLKAVLTGDAKLYGWSLFCDKEFLL